MTEEELWKTWADPSNWCEYMERGYPLSETKKDFFRDLDGYYIRRQQEELEETKAKLLDHMGKQKDDLEKAWKMDPKDLQQQIQREIKNLKSIKL